jgi:hypothetical protein
MVPGVLNGGAWTRDGHILFAVFGEAGLYRVHENGGEPTLLAAPPTDQSTMVYRWPHLLPGERTVLFTAFAAPTAGEGVSETQSQILALSTATASRPGGSSRVARMPSTQETGIW